MKLQQKIINPQKNFKIVQKALYHANIAQRAWLSKKRVHMAQTTHNSSII